MKDTWRTRCFSSSENFAFSESLLITTTHSVEALTSAVGHPFESVAARGADVFNWLTALDVNQIETNLHLQPPLDYFSSISEKAPS